MKIFPKESQTKSQSASSASGEVKEKKGISRKKAEAPIKKEISASAIKEKLAAHVDTSEAAKNMAIRNSKKLGEGFMNENMKVEMVQVEAPLSASDEEIKTPNTKDLTIKSDIAMNDPKDTNTQEKLKSVISKGAFNFNPKEREALEKILAG